MEKRKSRDQVSSLGSKRAEESLEWIVHRVDNLKVHLNEVFDLLITGDSEGFPGIAEGTIVIVDLGRRPTRIGPRIPCPGWPGTRFVIH
jgi:hypothetical protein